MFNIKRGTVKQCTVRAITVNEKCNEYLTMSVNMRHYYKIPTNTKYKFEHAHKAI